MRANIQNIYMLVTEQLDALSIEVRRCARLIMGSFTFTLASHALGCQVDCSYPTKLSPLDRLQSCRPMQYFEITTSWSADTIRRS